MRAGGADCCGGGGVVTAPQEAARSAMLAAKKKPKAKAADIIRAGTDAASEAMGYRDRLQAWKVACEVFEGMKG